MLCGLCITYTRRLKTERVVVIVVVIAVAVTVVVVVVMVGESLARPPTALCVPFPG